jgi:hypothetical protein
LSKLAAILLFAIHLFNFVGHKALMAFLHSKQNQIVENVIDKQSFAETELVTFNIPYPLPYAANWTEYESASGSVVINGIEYNYVQRKLANDTFEKTKLNAISGEIVKVLTASNSKSCKENNTPTGKYISLDFSSEYNPASQNFVFNNAGEPIANSYIISNSNLFNCSRTIPFTPPRYIA